jgi:hypothetical protein
MPPIIQLEDDVDVTGPRFVGRHNGQLSRHSQVNDEVPVIVEIEHNPLAAAAGGSDAAVGKLVAPGPGPRPAQGLPPHAHGGDAAADQVRVQVANNGFDFG